MISSRVRFTSPNAGYDSDKKNAMILTKGQIYTVQRVEEHGYSTTVYLCDFPGRPFNSVHFENVQPPH